MHELLEKIKQDINGYHDIVSDLKDEWSSLNDVLDFEVKSEADILASLLMLINGFEECIFESVDKIEKIQKGE